MNMYTSGIKNKHKTEFYILPVLLLLLNTLTAQNRNIDSLLVLISKSKPDTNKVKHYNRLCKEYVLIGNYDEALLQANNALELAQQLSNTRGVAVAYTNFNNIYLNKSNYPLSMEYGLKALKIFEQINDRKAMASVYGNIGVIYFDQGDTEQALKNYLKALKIVEALGDKSRMATQLGNIGNVYLTRLDYNKALENYNKALKLSEEVNDKNGIARHLGSIGNIHFEQKLYTEALEYYLKAKQITEQIGDKEGVSIWLGNIGRLYNRAGDYQKAEQNLKEALAIQESIGATDYLRQSEDELSALYLATGNHKDALVHYKKAVALKDSILSQENKKEIVRKEAQYEIEKREKELQIQRLLLNQKSTQIYVLVIVSVLIIIIALLFIRQLRTNSRQKTIELQQKLLRSQMNPHFIFNALNSIQNYLYENDPDNAAVYLSKFAALMRLILDNSREEYISLQSEIKTLELYLELQQLRFENRFNYSIDIDKGLDIDFIAIPPMLAQPFIENAIEHGLAGKKENGEITISFKLEDETILFEVKDNGIGITDSFANKKDTQKSHKSLGTNITKERLEMLNKGRKNKIWYKIIDLKTEGSGNITGTKVIFSIPSKYL